MNPIRPVPFNLIEKFSFVGAGLAERFNKDKGRPFCAPGHLFL